MLCNETYNEWKFIPVETADEVISRGDLNHCKHLKNWNRWLKIRKKQHKYLGLMVCRSSTSLLMNESDNFRSKVECKWMVDMAQKLKTNSEYNRDFPYSIAKEINNFTSVYVPDVVRIEKGILGVKEDARVNFQIPTLNVSLNKELDNLKSLWPVRNTEKLAIVGENIVSKLLKSKIGYKGTIPSIYVESVHNYDDCNDDSIVAIKINNVIMKSFDNISKFEAFKLNTTSKPVNIIHVNKDFWDEIVLENCGQVSVQFEWKKENTFTTKYDSILKKRPVECFYFDTRNGILGPGQIKRLAILFRPKMLGSHRETWVFQVKMLGRLDPIVRVRIPLQGCAISDVDVQKVAMELRKSLLSEQIKVFCGKLTNTIVKSVFPENTSTSIEKYHYHDEKMKYLYRKLKTKKTLGIDELLYQCMQLEQSLREYYLNLISQTAVVLLNREIIFEHNQMTLRELNSHKTMHIVLNCIDLIMNTYESDYDEAYQELNTNKKITDKSLPKLMKNSENDISVDITTKNKTADVIIMREEWLEMIKPIIYNRLEWAIEIIFDYDTQWIECQH